MATGKGRVGRLGLTDDRNRSVRVFPLARTALGVGEAGRLPAAAVRRTRRAVLGPLVFWWCIAAALVAGVSWIVSRVGLDGAPLMGLFVHSPVILTAMGAVFFVFRVTAAVHARHRDRVERLLLAEKHCPSCGHGLAGLPLDSEALVTCPECSAAWFARRLGHEAAGVAPPRVVTPFISAPTSRPPRTPHATSAARAAPPSVNRD